MRIKTAMLMVVALAASVLFGQAATGAKYASLASARAKITEVIENPSEMKTVMQTLSPADQKTFIAEVMAAISIMPGDESERTEKFVAVVNSGLSGAQKGNALTLVAEVFATVPPTSLAAVNESLASGLMNRAADPNTTFTDDQYIKIAQKVMETVNERVANEDNAGVRSGFAALMLIRGSNSESPEITSAVVDALPQNVQNDAKTEWIPAALGQGQAKSYDPMLAVVDGEVGRPIADDATATTAAPAGATGTQAAEGTAAADSETGTMFALRVAGPQTHDCLLTDIGGAGTDPSFTPDASNPVVDAVNSPLNYELPNLGSGDAAGDSNSAVGEVVKEAEGYQNQTTQN